MTAIAITYTRGTFLISADGKGSWAVERRGSAEAVAKLQPSHSEQKIFCINDSDRIFAYALTGSTKNKSGSYDLARKMANVVLSLSSAHFPTSLDYLQAILTGLSPAVNSAQQSEHLPVAERAPVFARILFAGFFRGRPRTMFIDFKYGDEDPFVWDGSRPQAECSWLFGPEIFTPLFIAKDQRFSNFLRPLNSDSSLDEAEQFAKGYIDACQNALAVEIDPQCEEVGGHFHSAAVSRSGFEWRTPPLTVGLKQQ